MSTTPSKGAQQPEALSQFAESARNEHEKPGLKADKDTAPIKTNPKLKQDAATKVLREGVLHDDEGAEEAIEKLPDRTEKK